MKPRTFKRAAKKSSDRLPWLLAILAITALSLLSWIIVLAIVKALAFVL